MTRAEEFKRFQQTRKIVEVARTSAKAPRHFDWVDGIYAGVAIVAVAAAIILAIG